MGLDITAYERVALVPSGDYERDEMPRYERGGVWLTLNRDFLAQADGLVEGEYAVAGERFAFRAGSYSGYNHWRGQLCRMAHGMTADEFWGMRDDPKRPKDFADLIDFSSAFLARAFGSQKYRDRAETFAATMVEGDGVYWLAKYNEWLRAFELAAGNGAVSFH